MWPAAFEPSLVKAKALATGHLMAPITFQWRLGRMGSQNASDNLP